MIFPGRVLVFAQAFPIIGHMAKRRAKQKTFSDQIRQVIERSGLTRYRIAQETGIEESTLSRFMSGEHGLSTATLDKLAELLDLEVVVRKKKRS